MRWWKAVLPLPLAFMLQVASCVQIACAAQSEDLIPGVSPWLTILATQGLAVLLVVWWIVKGYPDWVSANQKQQECWRDERKEDSRLHLAMYERTLQQLTELTVSIRQKPCLLENKDK
jgi:hypothetical protein